MFVDAATPRDHQQLVLGSALERELLESDSSELKSKQPDTVTKKDGAHARNVRCGPDKVRTRSVDVDANKPTQIVCRYSDSNMKHCKRHVKKE